MTGDNNGNVYSQTLDAPGLPATLTQDYSYDPVNRLGGVTETGGGTNWSRAYTYDPYGNRAAGTPVARISVLRSAAFPDQSANNRLTATWAGYDNAGNLTTFKVNGFEWSAAYDADNKQTAFCPATESACGGVAPGSKTSYDYDGDGNRVRKIVNNAQASLYVYNAFGNLAAEYTDFTPAGPSGTHYRTTDHLGSTRVVTDATAPTPQVLSRRDFFPFGEEIPANATYGNRDQVKDGQANTTYNDPSGYRQQFTGQERDEESELDYFWARYHSGSLGRFTSADPMFGWPSDPQSWNAYAYGRNNPLLYTDPTGTNYVICNADGENCADLTDDQYKEYRKSNANISKDLGGTLFVTNEDGSVTKIGSARYYDEKPFEMLGQVGDRAARDTSTFMISSAVFTTAYISTYAVPAIVAGLTAMGEIGAVGAGVELLKAAKRFKLSITHPAIQNLKMTVDQYISSFRKAGVRGRMPGEFLQNTVEEALASGDTTVRKLLVDGRWAK